MKQSVRPDRLDGFWVHAVAAVFLLHKMKWKNKFVRKITLVGWDCSSLVDFLPPFVETLNLNPAPKTNNIKSNKVQDHVLYNV